MGEALLVRKGGGAKVTIDGEQIKENMDFDSFISEHDSTSCPTSVGTAPGIVVYRNEIHVIGGSKSNTAHYKYNGGTKAWTSVTTLPFNFSYGVAVVYNDEIHIVSGTKHYKFNGDTNAWTSVSTLPKSYSGRGGCVVFNGEIHILIDAYPDTDTFHYKYNDGTKTWTLIGTLPYQPSFCGCVVLNNAIHILGGETTDTSKNHYKFSGNTWSSVGNLPYAFFFGSCVVFEGEIHLLGGNASADTNRHCIYNPTSDTWRTDSMLHDFQKAWNCAVVYNDSIHGIDGAYQTSQHFELEKVYRRNFFN